MESAHKVVSLVLASRQTIVVAGELGFGFFFYIVLLVGGVIILFGGLDPYVCCKLLVKSLLNNLNKKCCMHQFDAKARGFNLSFFFKKNKVCTSQLHVHDKQ
jgi:hypothetical protein